MIAIVFSCLLAAASAGHYAPHVAVHKTLIPAGADKADVSVQQDNHQFSYKVSTAEHGGYGHGGYGHGGYGHGGPGYGSSYQYVSQAKAPIVAHVKTHDGYGHHGSYHTEKVGYAMPYNFKYGFHLATPKVVAKETVVKTVPVVKEVVKHVPVVKEVVRHVPVVKEVPVVKHVPVHIPVVHKKVVHTHSHSTGYKTHGYGHHGYGHHY